MHSKLVQISNGRRFIKRNGLRFFDVFSAGSHPSIVNPISIEVMREVGIDISSHRSEPISKYLNIGIDIVVTVCDNARATCPTFPGSVQRLHWSIKDPRKKSKILKIFVMREMILKKSNGAEKRIKRNYLAIFIK